MGLSSGGLRRVCWRCHGKRLPVAGRGCSFPCLLFCRGVAGRWRPPNRPESRAAEPSGTVLRISIPPEAAIVSKRTSRSTWMTCRKGEPRVAQSEWTHSGLLWTQRPCVYGLGLRFTSLRLIDPTSWIVLIQDAEARRLRTVDQSFIITRAWLVISATAGCAMRRSAVMAWNCTRHFSARPMA